METIGEQQVWSFVGNGPIVPANCTEIRKAAACEVTSYLDLATKVAELQFRNRDYVLLYRGQRADHRNRSGNTSVKPSLLRAPDGLNPLPDTLQTRYKRLEYAEARLGVAYADAGFIGRERLERQQVLRWSILQHYEVCATPLLDVTHSLRIAASFASDGADEYAYVFVLGVPNLSGAITASAEAGVQVIRLSSVCPPAALRPHIQEGYLLGEYPELVDYDQKKRYAHYELDFGRRLIAKFRFRPSTFWTNPAFPKVERSALYPDGDDPLLKIAEYIKSLLTPIL